MHSRRTLAGAAALSAAVAATLAPGAGAASRAQQYVVLNEAGVSQAAAERAVERAGGQVVGANRRIGVTYATSANERFVTDVSKTRAVVSATSHRPIGAARPDLVRKRDQVEALGSTAGSPDFGTTAVSGDPFTPLQWDMEMIHATPDGSYAVNQGSKDVLVGVMDTGVDGSHPDIAPNFNGALSRNFTTDIPLVDGACEEESDAPTADPCKDPADVDQNGHGTHVASTIGSPLNGIGMAGVAPNVSLVNLRAGQDSGYFFLQSTLDAMTYAGDVGIDVVNMSFYTDPWLYNCADNPADSPAEQLEQLTVIRATQRAINYGSRNGVTYISSAGNGDTDLSDPTFDDTSPDFPPGSERERFIDNGCITVPTETQGVISVSAVGPTGEKSYYSNWGLGDIDVAAPGGDRRVWGTEWYNTPQSRILAAYPKNVGVEVDETIDPETGEPTTPLVLRDPGNPDAYYQFIQGTSMASPHAAGVAALIVSQFGKPDRKHGGVRMLPREVREQLLIRATDVPCPDPRLKHYEDPALDPADYDAYCEGGRKYNSFYGQGIVDALRSLSRP